DVLGPWLPAKQLEAVVPHRVAERGQPARKPVRKCRILDGIADEEVIAHRHSDELTGFIAALGMSIAPESYGWRRTSWQGREPSPTPSAWDGEARIRACRIGLSCVWR